MRSYTFKPDTEQYWTHITTGTHVAQICMFLMVESRFIPGVLLQPAPPKKQTRAQPGTFALIDLDLSRYDLLAQRFEQELRDALDFLKSGIATRNKGFNDLIDVCRQARTLSEAGRKLFDRSRMQRTVVNDADRLRKYLQKHGLSWEAVSARP